MSSDQPYPRTTPSGSPRIDVLTDAVITAYIHEISERHRHVDAVSPLRDARGRDL